MRLDLLEMFGSGYLLEHIRAEHKRAMEEKLFYVYMSDMAKFMAETWGGKVESRYSELIRPQEDTPESGDEVALSIINKLGLKGKTNGLHETESEPIA